MKYLLVVLLLPRMIFLIGCLCVNLMAVVSHNETLLLISIFGFAVYYITKRRQTT